MGRMSRKIELRSLKIVLYVAIGMMIFAFPFCKTDQPYTDQSVSLGISYEDMVPSWSPDGNYLAFTYGKEGANTVGRPAPGANICICDLSTGKWTQITTDGKHNKEPDWVVMQNQ